MKSKDQPLKAGAEKELILYYTIFTLESLLFALAVLLKSPLQGFLISSFILLPFWYEWKLLRNELNLRLYKMESGRLVRPALIHICKALFLCALQYTDLPELRTISWKLVFNSATLALTLLKARKPAGMAGLVLVAVCGVARNAARTYDCVVALGQCVFCIAVQYNFAEYQEEVTELFMKRIKEVFALLPMPLVILDKDNSVTFKNEEAFEFFDKFKDVHRGSIELFFKSLLEMNKSGTSLHQNLEQFQKDTAASIQGQIKWIQDYFLKNPFHKTLHTNYFNVKMLWSNRLPLPSQSDKLLLVFTDISAKEILKEQVELDNMKSALIATISHELRTPLNGIIGILYIVSEKLSREVKTWWNATFASAQVLANTVNCMVDFSCLETDQFRICNGCLNIRELFAELAELFASIIVKDKVRLLHSVSKDVPHTFKTDPVRVKQILMNLLTNSANYTYNGSVEMQATMKEGKLQIEVKDTGIGISKESQESLTSVLEDRCGRACFTAYKSAGLGLTISSRLVKALGGTMSFKSVLEIGSTFTFVLKELEKTNSCQLRISQKPMEADRTSVGLPIKKRRGTYVSIELDKFNFMKTAELLTSSGNTEKKRNPIEETKLRIPYQFSEIESDSDVDGSVCDELSFQENNTPATLIKHSLCKSAFDFELGSCAPRLLSEKRSAPLGALQVQREVEILIVDDITINRLVLGGMLRNIGYTPKEAFNGKEACKLVLASNIRFNIVLMDVQMPVMDGVEATINIRQTYNPEQLPIVGVTALSSEPEVEKCIIAGMNEVMIKPLSLNNLKLLIERYKL